MARGFQILLLMIVVAGFRALVRISLIHKSSACGSVSDAAKPLDLNKTSKKLKNKAPAAAFQTPQSPSI